MRRLSEFTWTENDAGAVWELADRQGEAVAEVSADDETGLWSWCAILPEKYQCGGNPTGFVRSKKAAMLLCETILLNTILRRG
jgi:hypothetical protein